MKKCISILILVISTTILFSQSNEFIVASYNLRLYTMNDGENIWENRIEMVQDLIKYHEFDIVATQELMYNQIEGLLEMEGWSYVGGGRDDGLKSGEHSAIFYKNELFEVLENGDFWLSETPDVPGKGWDATCCNRIASWAKFKNLTDSSIFYLFNVHFDHEGELARENSAYLMISKIKEIAGNSPTILCGDFNSTPETKQMKYISDKLNDAYFISEEKPYGPVGTFNDFKIDAEFKERIDYIFLSDSFGVRKYATLTDSNHQRFPSDHIPVVTKLYYKK